MRPRAVIALAAIGSGVPSTITATLRGTSVLDSTRAAGTIIVGHERSPTVQLVAGVLAHSAISTFWGAMLWHALPPRHAPWWGGAGGLGIAALDLGIIGRRVPAIRQLPLAPQLADHLAFGVILGWGRKSDCSRPAHGWFLQR